MINRIKMTLIAAAICFLCGCGSRNEAVLINAVQSSGTESADLLSPEETENTGSTDYDPLPEKAESAHGEKQMIVVHVCGAVDSPGVYTLKEDCRVWDAIEAAGGFSEDASTDYLNLAGSISDGQKVYVPTIVEADSWAEDGCDTGNPIPQGDSQSASDSSQPPQTAGLVNINTADQVALTGLPGIGEAKAKNIIAYRTEHGRFSSIEEIMEIPGIKEAVFSKIKEYITVD